MFFRSQITAIMLKEEYLQELLKVLYEKGSLEIYDYIAKVKNRGKKQPLLAKNQSGDNVQV